MVFISMKICKKCGIEKDDNDFYRENRNITGLMGSCKECYNILQKKHRDNNAENIKTRHKIYYENNKEKLKEYRTINEKKLKEYKKEYDKNNKEKIREHIKIWKSNNKEKVSFGAKLYRSNNIDKIKKYRSGYRITNIDKINQNRKKNQGLINLYLKNRRNNDPLYKLTINVRNRVKSFLKIKQITKKNKTFDLIGVTPEALKEHLEKLFTTGMSWENYGKWHIDHIIPLSSAKTEEELYRLCHYTNLQPLWAEDNLKKSNKLIKNQIL
jgi:hypothetical protein